MHRSTVPAFVLACLSLTACTSSTGPDGLMAGIPSKETTSSVTPSAPVPQASVGQSQAPLRAEPSQKVLAWGGPVPAESPAFAAVDHQSAMPAMNRPMAPQAGVISPNERPVQMAMAAAPAMNAGPAVRSRIFRSNFSDAKPINFGSVTPRHFPVHGVDVSRWQANIDWERLRSRGANFAFIKATDGGDHLDPMFKTNWNRAKAAGVKRGAYHFFYWCRAASHQAEWFIRNVPRDPDALPPVIDVEYNGESSCKMRLPRAKVLEKMQVFMDMLERHYGKRPIIYTAPDFYKDHLSGEFQNYPFWLRAVAQHPSKVYPDRKWLFWQYSGSGLSHGVDGKIDLNVFSGSEEAWQRWSSRG
ncbi:glycoside hydrolase family 25 protein [Agrobacterium rubi]|uniref:glycoside hydrolase family 25 protein n=1 Tax=Agrobacterium rubi TaxID=28099 RepID=UPI001574C01D|nr:GH25 family lysozyme [Agrobacterium rubi]NTF06231.1 glycoside hydrolase family 25 protein [Agrobacterium rubi]NTF18472.1 glycoside hydrolase family 25 protein [Agrobacterium rubi]NTF25436.1 glycoside hydrolase family 25 protein [Agrobacterium rubi]